MSRNIHVLAFDPGTQNAGAALINLKGDRFHLIEGWSIVTCNAAEHSARVRGRGQSRGVARWFRVMEIVRFAVPFAPFVVCERWPATARKTSGRANSQGAVVWPGGRFAGTVEAASAAWNIPYDEIEVGPRVKGGLGGWRGALGIRAGSNELTYAAGLFGVKQWESEHVCSAALIGAGYALTR